MTDNKKTDEDRIEEDELARIEREEKRDRAQGIRRPAGHYSNSIIRRRNGGVRHQFENDIGGCGDNYR